MWRWATGRNMSVKLGRTSRQAADPWPNIQWRICQSSRSAPTRPFLCQRWESHALDLLVAKDAWYGNAEGDKVIKMKVTQKQRMRKKNVFGVRL